MILVLLAIPLAFAIPVRADHEFDLALLFIWFIAIAKYFQAWVAQQN